MLALILLPLELAVAAVVLVTQQAQRAGQAELRRVRMTLREGQRLSEARRRVREGQARVEKTVDCSTDTLEAVHLALADLSFDIWGSGNAGKARAAHHRHAGTVYQSIRLANRGVGRLVSGLFRDDGKPDGRDRDD